MQDNLHVKTGALKDAAARMETNAPSANLPGCAQKSFSANFRVHLQCLDHFHALVLMLGGIFDDHLLLV